MADKKNKKEVNHQKKRTLKDYTIGSMTEVNYHIDSLGDNTRLVKKTIGSSTTFLHLFHGELECTYKTLEDMLIGVSDFNVDNSVFTQKYLELSSIENFTTYKLEVKKHKNIIIELQVSNSDESVRMSIDANSETIKTDNFTIVDEAIGFVNGFLYNCPPF